MREVLFVGVLGLALGCKPALAQDLSAQADNVEELVVTGSRAAPRAATETSAPVDVLSEQAISQTGYSDLSKTLQSLAPSFNYPRTATSFSASGTRGATLRGLTPDQTLVLVNGHRWHASSVLVTNSTNGRGTVPVDLNTLPASSIQRIEILRDGASAQYGSDAIAGVINVVLRDDDAGGFASIQYGSTERGDGETWIASLAHGLELGDAGHLTLTGELRDRGSTNGAGIDPRVGRVTQREGDPDQTDADAVINWLVPLTGATEVYGFTTLARRISNSAPLFRLPSVAPTVYPQGFLPEIELKLWDAGNSVGIRGDWADWNWDLSDTFGYNRADFSVSNTVNTSLIGTQTPLQTAFDGGGSRYSQNIANLTVTREFPSLLAGANLALGVEHRYEGYELVSGEPNSYFGTGSQGLPGYHPPAPVDESRAAISAFADFETRLTERLRLGLAARYENYNDFGDKVTGKVSLFWRASQIVAFRATASTGFRAPSLQQQYFSSVTSQLDLTTQNLVNIGTFAVNDPVARALGASPLRPETSKSYSGGIVLTPLDELTLTVDAYHIAIDDRISLSESLQGAAVQAVLSAQGILNANQARFFTNAADTVTKGWEATANWRHEIASAKLDLTLAYGTFDNDLDRLRGNPVLPSLSILGPISLGLILDAQPRDKFTFAGAVERGKWRFSLNAARYGTVTTPDTGQVFGAELTMDASVGFEVSDHVRLLAGVTNITDNFPDQIVPNPDGRRYSELSPIGIEGREYFFRISSTF